jgi:hypothetical protein
MIFHNSTVAFLSGTLGVPIQLSIHAHTWRDATDIDMMTGSNGPFAFFVRRWERQVRLGTLFWRDMLVVATLINLAAAFVSLMALGFKAELPVVLAVFHAPMPYNIFLVGAVWRTAQLADAARASTARFGAAAWLVAMTVL